MASATSSWENIEKALGSKGRLRILRCLYENLPSSLTRYGISKRTGLDQSEAKRDLEVLLELAWISTEPLTPPTFRLNLENPSVKSFVAFLETLRIRK